MAVLMSIQAWSPGTRPLVLPPSISSLGMVTHLGRG